MSRGQAQKVYACTYFYGGVKEIKRQVFMTAGPPRATESEILKTLLVVWANEK